MVVYVILGVIAAIFAGSALFTYFTLVRSIQKAKRIAANASSFCYPTLRSEVASKPAARDYYIPEEPVDYKKADKLFEAALPPPTGEGYVVIGGSGFVGSHLCNSLVQRGDVNVVNMDLRPPRMPHAAAIRYVKGDISDLAQLERAFDEAIKIFEERGVRLTTVYMTAAIIRFQDNFSWQLGLSRKINIHGTSNVIQVITRERSTVRYFIQTSTSHVVLGYDQQGYNLTEKTPYTLKPFNHYQRTKIEAEKLTLAANKKPIPGSSHPLLTASIRPCSGIFGAYDGFCVDLVYRNAMTKAPLQVCIAPNNIMDWVYAGNLVLGFNLLERGLRENPSAIAGEVFNISGEEILPTIEFDRKIMYFLPYMRPLIGLNPVFSTILAKIADVGQLLGKSMGDLDFFSSAAWDMGRLDSGFNIDKAKKLLGYRPVYTVDQGIQKAIASMEADHRAGVKTF